MAAKVTLTAIDDVWLAEATNDGIPVSSGQGGTESLALAELAETLLAMALGQAKSPAPTEGFVEGSMSTKSVLAAIIGQQGGEILLGDVDFEGVNQNPTIEVRQHRGKQRYTVAKEKT